MWIAFARSDDNKGWSTLGDVDAVVAPQQKLSAFLGRRTVFRHLKCHSDEVDTFGAAGFQFTLISLALRGFRWCRIESRNLAYKAVIIPWRLGFGGRLDLEKIQIAKDPSVTPDASILCHEVVHGKLMHRFGDGNAIVSSGLCYRFQIM
jgi:hypothetical protein